MGVFFGSFSIVDAKNHSYEEILADRTGIEKVRRNMLSIFRRSEANGSDRKHSSEGHPTTRDHLSPQHGFGSATLFWTRINGWVTQRTSGTYQIR